MSRPPMRADSLAGMARKLLILGLVMILVVLAVPIMVPGMGSCSDCGFGVVTGMVMCGVLVVLALFVLSFLSGTFHLDERRTRILLLARRFHRPPRTV